MAVKNQKGSLYENPKQDPKWSERWKGKEFREYKTATYNKISELLISKFSQIEETFGINFQSLQKTFRDGKLQKGKSEGEMSVIFENDLDAN